VKTDAAVLSCYFYCYVYVFLLLCMFCSVYFVFIVPTGTLRLPRQVFPCFFLSRKAGYNPQRRGTARTFPKLIVFVCKCILYCCLWVSTQLQLNISIYIYILWIVFWCRLGYKWAYHFKSRPCSSAGLLHELVNSGYRLLLAFHVPRWPFTPHFVAVECVVLQVRCVKEWRKYS